MSGLVGIVKIKFYLLWKGAEVVAELGFKAMANISYLYEDKGRVSGKKEEEVRKIWRRREGGGGRGGGGRSAR